MRLRICTCSSESSLFTFVVSTKISRGNLFPFQGLLIKHERTGLCLDLDETGPIMNKCDTNILTQLWQFNTYVKDA